MKTSIILSTYKQPKWLRKTLLGYVHQDTRNFEIVIADDGSGEETRKVIEHFQHSAPFAIKHVWHDDDGFRKSTILNKAILFSEGDYLIFSDGDCIPRHDFVSTHLDAAQPGHFISGGYCKLPLDLSRAITEEDIRSGRCFQSRWLGTRGFHKLDSMMKIGLHKPLSRLADGITPTKATWNGCNASGWTQDILAVNGHDESMQYGGQDREMGERLMNLGVQAKQFRHRAVLLHLDHPRGYKTPESIRKNLAVRAATRSSGSTWTPRGIVKSARKSAI
ncbi:glycosyltransferase family 2 protein [Verrucomicrobiaceae bacterium R5-34]|nr:glycosyltransferase family 2 protein [Verrucomicrobiaceae bacterium R5-34]